MISHSVTRRGRIAIGGALIVTFLAINAAVSFQSGQRLYQMEQSINHTYQALDTVDAALAALVDAETAQRGYVITGERRYLDPYRKTIASIDQRFSTLDQQVSGDPRLAELAAELRQLANDRLRQISDVLAARQRSFDEAQQLIAMNLGIELMDRIREVVQQMNQIGHQSLDRKALLSEQSLWRLEVNILMCLLVGMVLVAGVGYALHRADQQLQAAHEISQHNENRYRTLIEATSAIVWDTPPSGEVVGELPGWMRSPDRRHRRFAAGVGFERCILTTGSTPGTPGRQPSPNAEFTRSNTACDDTTECIGTWWDAACPY